MKLFYTTAPEAYDGFGTKTVETGWVFIKLDKSEVPIRKVSIHDDHVDWQTMRYQSGMYPAWSEEGFRQQGQWIRRTK